MTQDHVDGRAIIRKVIWHIMPMLLLSYFVASMDRANVGFAALRMNHDIGIDTAIYGWGAGIFFIGYVLFELPSNFLLERYGARTWIARIMLTWGIVAGLMSIVIGAKSFLALRFLLGVAEAGFFPGVMLYFTYWLPARYRGQAVGWMFLAYALSNSITPVISAYLFKMNGLFGLAGWQWMFIVEAVPALLLAIPVFLYLPDHPANCRWLTQEEAAWLERSIGEAQLGQREDGGTQGFWSCLKDLRILGFCAMWFTVLTAGYGITFFLPLMIKAASAATTMQIGLLSAIPYLIAIVGLIIFGYTSDRLNERYWHYFIFALISAAGFCGAAYWQSPAATVIGLSFAALGIYATRPAFWAVTTIYMNKSIAASGLALVSAIGSLGGFLGPYMIGFIRSGSHSYAPALYFLSVSMLVTAVLGLMAIPRGRSHQAARQPAVQSKGM